MACIGVPGVTAANGEARRRDMKPWRVCSRPTHRGFAIRATLAAERTDMETTLAICNMHERRRQHRLTATDGLNTIVRLGSIS